MAAFVGTRSATQCRSHHQKYEEKFGDAKTIINIYKNEVGAKKFKELIKSTIHDHKVKPIVAKESRELFSEAQNNSVE